MNQNELREKLKALVSEERKLLTTILEHLRTIEDQRFYLEWGFGSMFDYCTRELGYSEGAAQRRIQAMRLTKTIPDIKSKIADGSLSLSAASQAQSFFKEENKRRKADNKDLLTAEIKKEIVNSLLNTSKRECERTLLSHSSGEIVQKEKIRPVSSTQTTIQFTADQELFEILEKLKKLTSHKNPDGRYDLLFKEIGEIALNKLDPEKKSAKSTSKKVDIDAGIKKTPPAEFKKSPALKSESIEFQTAASKISRYIPANVRREIWKQNKGCCAYVNPVSKTRCNSKYQLQIEHIIPFAKGGTHWPGNLTLLCRSHNQLAAIQEYGLTKIEAYHSNKKPAS